MDALAGPYVVAAALLVLAGVLEVHRPDETVGALRALGLPVRRLPVRIGALLGAAIGVGALVVGGGAAGRVLAVLLATAYLAFATFVAAALTRRTPLASCGCFGRADTPPSITHLVLDLAAVGVAVGVAVVPGDGVSGAIAAQPAGGIPFVLFTAVSGFLAYLAFTALPRTLAAARRAQ